MLFGPGVSVIMEAVPRAFDPFERWHVVTVGGCEIGWHRNPGSGAFEFFEESLRLAEKASRCEKAVSIGGAFKFASPLQQWRARVFLPGTSKDCIDVTCALPRPEWQPWPSGSVGDEVPVPVSAKGVLETMVTDVHSNLQVDLHLGSLELSLDDALRLRPGGVIELGGLDNFKIRIIVGCATWAEGNLQFDGSNSKILIEHVGPPDSMQVSAQLSTRLSDKEGKF